MFDMKFYGTAVSLTPLISAVENHPTDEHLLPLFVALGAANNIETAQRLNRVMTFGLLAMDVWVFDQASRFAI